MLKVLMIGWEFPPYSVGGLGTHCGGIAEPLSKLVDLTFSVPFEFKKRKPNYMKVLETQVVKPTLSKKTGRCRRLYGTTGVNKKAHYNNYAKELLIKNPDFDIIHSQDWMTAFAAIALKKATGKKLIVTCHSTAFDVSRSPKKKKKFRYSTEKKLFSIADRIIAVSKFTKDILMKHHGISGRKIDIVHNAVRPGKNVSAVKKRTKKVLYVGRLVYQKGINHLIDAAKIVIDKDPKIKFVVVGYGSDKKKLKKEVKELGISKNVYFAGYVKDIDKAYKDADLFVMPSVSEPFGITPLEAMKNGTPAIISHQSGISEVVKSCKKYDYWDIDKLAKLILNLMNDNESYNKVRKECLTEIKKFSWNNAAKETLKVYKKLLKRGS